MSKTKHKWWGYVKNVIRDYPELAKEYAALHTQPITASVSAMPGGGGAKRGTENIALKELPAPKQREYDAVSNAISAIKNLKTAKEREKLVRMVFWEQSHTLAGAAMQLNISYDTAIDYHSDFIMLVAWHMGLATDEDLKPAQKFALKCRKNVLK